MANTLNYRRALIGWEVAIAFAVLAVLYLVRYIRFQPLQIPAYLLIVAYDLVEVALPMLNPYHPFGFPIFLYLVAIVGAGAARRLQTNAGDKNAWIRTVGGVALVIGVLSLLFGIFVGGPIVSPTDNPTPLAITATAGVIFLLVGWWLLGRPTNLQREA